MNTFKLSIVSPEGQLFDDHVEVISAPGAHGYFGVLASHAPMIVALKDGVMKVHDTNKEIFFAVDSGVFEVDVNGDTIALLDHIVECKTEEEAKIKSKELITS